MDNDQTYNTEPSKMLTPVRIRIIVGVILVILILFFLIWLLFGGSAQKQQSTNPSLPQPTTYIGSRQPEINSGTVKIAIEKIVKNIHWLNNKELAYTTYDRQLLRNIIAKNDGKTQIILSQELPLKFSEFHWSDTNVFLIFDFTTPNKTYLFTATNRSLNEIPIIGYGASWSPNSKQIFYVDGTDETAITAKLYTPESNSSINIPASFPSFSESTWSPDALHIALHTTNPDSDKPLYILDLSTNKITQVLPPGGASSNSDLSSQTYDPVWSPSGKLLAYVTSKGVHIKNIATTEDTLLYPIDGPVLTTTYTWINDDELLIIDSSSNSTKIISASVSQKTYIQTLKDLSLQPDQRIEPALSPDKKTLALATEKDNLLFVKLK